MEQTGLKEILIALELHSATINENIEKKFSTLDNKMDNFEKRMDNFENRMVNFENRLDNLESNMNERFDRLEAKLNGFRVELTETQETVDYLTLKTAQHEKKLRNSIK